MCKATALFCKALRSVQLRNIPQPPQRAWAGAPFAPQTPFAQKRDTKPVGGRGISVFRMSLFFRKPPLAGTAVIINSWSSSVSRCLFVQGCVQPHARSPRHPPVFYEVDFFPQYRPLRHRHCVNTYLNSQTCCPPKSVSQRLQGSANAKSPNAIHL